MRKAAKHAAGKRDKRKHRNRRRVKCDLMLQLWMLAQIGAPSVAMQLTFWMLMHAMTQGNVIDMVEYFAGHMAVTLAALKAGRVAVPFELENDAVYNDFLGVDGYIHAWNLGLCVIPGGGALGAPVCSTWVPINVGTSGRSSYRPCGNWWYQATADANVMVSRMVLLLYLFTAKGVFWILEQPKGSLMEHHPRLKKFIRMIEMR